MRYVSSMINGILLSDGWHAVAGQVAIDYDPTIVDPVTGVPATPRGGPWVRWLEPNGVFTFAPLDRVIALRHTPVVYSKTGGWACRASGDGVRA
jgi:hypothetical protein